MSEWHPITWGDIATLEYGKTLRDYRNSKGTVPVYGTNGPIGFTDEPLFDGAGVVIGRKGAYRGVHYSDKPFFVIDTAFYLKPKPDVELDTLFSYYQLLTKNINAMDSGSAIPSTSREDFYNLDLDLPTIGEQKEIAEILSSLDEKIELNRKQNRTLEDIAQALFKRWFVEFELPDENGRPYKSGGGAMQSSELGEIPVGWEVKPLQDFGKIVCGKTPPTAKKQYFGKDIPFIKIPDMHGSMYVVSTGTSLSNEGADSQSNKFISKDSICVSCIATVGLVSITPCQAQTNQQINSIVPITGHLRAYLYFTLKLLRHELVNIGSSGSATLNVNTGVFSAIPVLMPEQKYLVAFHDQVDVLFNKILSNSYEVLVLANLRDTLLPKLMSGELRVA